MQKLEPRIQKWKRRYKVEKKYSDMETSAKEKTMKRYENIFRYFFLVIG
jgi:hypothetical protein